MSRGHDVIIFFYSKTKSLVPLEGYFDSDQFLAKRLGSIMMSLRDKGVNVC